MSSYLAPRARRHSFVLGVAAVLALVLALACNSAPASQPSSRTAPSQPVAASSAPSGGAPAASQPAAAPAAPVESTIPAQPVKLKLAYSQIWGANVVPWLAYEAGVFQKHGLDVEMSYVASSQTVPAVISGDVDISIGGGWAVINSKLAGSDLVMFYNAMNWHPYLLMTSPDINTAAELRGKTLGISRFGSASDIATRAALQKIGLVPERDVVLIQVGSLQERIAAMKTGAIAGGVAAPPDTLILKRQGFKTVYDLSQSNDSELPNSIFASERWLRANDATAQNFVNAMLEATHLAKTNREASERVLAQYLKLDDAEAIAESYEGFVNRMERAPDLGVAAARSYLQEQQATDARAVGARPEEFFETRYMDRARASGIVERLYGN